MSAKLMTPQIVRPGIVPPSGLQVRQVGIPIPAANQVLLRMEASAYGTYAMRFTKVTQIYKKTGNLRVVQLLLLGHTKMDGTVRYLGVEFEVALAIAEAIENK